MEKPQTDTLRDRFATVRADFRSYALSSFWSVKPVPLGAVGSCAVMLGSLQPNSGFTSKIPGSWFIGVPSNPVVGNGLAELGANFLVYLGLVLTGVAWLRIVLGTRRGEQDHRPWVAFALWIIPLMIAGPLFSRDVYSYAAQGQMITVGLSPYRGGPASLGTSPFMATVDPLWGRSPAPYGPLFLMMDGALVQLSGHSPLYTVLLLRLVALGSVIGIGIYVRKIARLKGFDPNLAFFLSALNPILLYSFASAGHNDALMTFLMVAGIYYFLRDYRLFGILLVVAACSIKIPAIIALGFMGFNWSRSHRARDRFRGLLIAVMIAAAIFTLLGEISHLGFGWIPALSTPGSVLSFEDPLDAVGYLLGLGVHLVGLGSSHSVISVFRVLGDVGILVLGGIAILGSNRRNWVRLAGVVLLISTILGPVIWPWYLGWGITLLAIGSDDLTMDFVLILTLSAVPIDLLGLPTVLAWFGYIGLGIVLYRGRHGLMREICHIYRSFCLVLAEIVPRPVSRHLPGFLSVKVQGTDSL